MNLDEIIKILLPHFETLKRFQFTYDNPLFWAGLVLIFLILAWFWGWRKSFSFCFLTGLILLGNTKLEAVVTEMVAKSWEIFDPFILRAASLFVITIILVYYLFLKDS